MARTGDPARQWGKARADASVHASRLQEALLRRVSPGQEDDVFRGSQERPRSAEISPNASLAYSQARPPGATTYPVTRRRRRLLVAAVAVVAMAAAFSVGALLRPRLESLVARTPDLALHESRRNVEDWKLSHSSSPLRSRNSMSS